MSDELDAVAPYVDVLFDVLRWRRTLPAVPEATPEAAAHLSVLALLDDSLDAFRMSVTNVPVEEQTVTAAAARLQVVLREAQACGVVVAADLVDRWSQRLSAFSESAAVSDTQVVATHTGREACVGRTPRQCLPPRRLRDRATAAGNDAASTPRVSGPPSVPAYRLKSCYQQQEMHEVIERLYCSSFHAAADRAVLDRFSITHICCCINAAPRFPAHYTYLTLAAEDRPEFDMSQYFEAACDFIRDALTAGGGAVLVHCGAGISRAPTIVAAYLIRERRMPAADAVNFIVSRRSCARPNRGFVKQLEAFAERNRCV